MRTVNHDMERALARRLREAIPTDAVLRAAVEQSRQRRAEADSAHEKAMAAFWRWDTYQAEHPDEVSTAMGPGTSEIDREAYAHDLALEDETRLDDKAREARLQLIGLVMERLHISEGVAIGVVQKLMGWES